ncbi:hypothetical protein I7I48_07732 [Histoplasma ohiense]|nr:hypothetical protein I7I48_07732 [Histoplasma ohiense (nom. inval.)]
MDTESIPIINDKSLFRHQNPVCSQGEILFSQHTVPFPHRFIPTERCIRIAAEMQALACQDALALQAR